MLDLFYTGELQFLVFFFYYKSKEMSVCLILRSDHFISYARSYVFLIPIQPGQRGFRFNFAGFVTLNFKSGIELHPTRPEHGLKFE